MSKQVCIAAGVGPGIGAAVARCFAAAGFDLALIARRQSRLDELARELSGRGVEARGFAADLADPDSIGSAFARIGSHFPAPDVLVYNAAGWHAQPIMTLDARTFTADLMLCATGALGCAQRVYPAMRTAGRGTILFTGGGLALHPETGAGIASLTAGKSALRGLTYAMAKELAPAGIHVAIVTVTGFVKPGTAFDPDRIAAEYLALHRQDQASWEVERVFSGRGK